MPRRTKSSRDTTDRKSRNGREKTGQRKQLRALEGVTDIDPTDYDFLDKFLTEHGKVVSARLTGASAKQQRQIKRAVRRARVMGLLP